MAEVSLHICKCNTCWNKLDMFRVLKTLQVPATTDPTFRPITEAIVDILEQRRRTGTYRCDRPGLPRFARRGQLARRFTPRARGGVVLPRGGPPWAP